jgi:hypothetical protein
MSFTSLLARQQEAIFGALADWGTWEGVSGNVRVRRREQDSDIALGQAVERVTTRMLLVRKAEVPVPVEGQIVQLLDDDLNPVAGGRYAIVGEPHIDRKSIWHCEATLLPDA